jgi:hypothetical protein
MIHAARRSVPVAILLTASVLIPTAGATFSETASNDANSFTSAADFNTNPSFRVTTYEAVIADGLSKATLTLNQTLASDYFVLLRGAAGNYTSGTNRGPDVDYARIDQDPFGNFAAGSSVPNRLRLSRIGTTGAWTGQVTVVECIADCDNSGFRLNRVNEITMNSGVASASSTSGGSWGGGDLGQIGLYGGSYGGGMETTETGPANHKTGWARIYPQGGNRVNVTRSNTGPGSISGVTTFTIYVVQWGDDWTIQRARVQGNAGGNGMNVVNDYDTASISTVARTNTWVWAAGQVDANSLSAGWEGNVWTLGTGVSNNANENTVAVGAESGATRDVEVYVHTHPDLGNQYLFGADGTAPGIVSTSLNGTTTIAGPLSPETHNSGNTEGRRFILVANSTNGNGTAYPRSIVWGQIAGDTAARWQRSRSGQPGAYWMQTPDFGDIGS